eukprot:Rhum_TRINITY_DN984_c0_g1::Rhum_TRINITY_DN984_c0_g1_i1::g.2917::m.2917
MAAAGRLYGCGSVGAAKGVCSFPTTKGVDAAGDCPYLTPVSFPEDIRCTKVVADQGLFAVLDAGGGVWCWAGTSRSRGDNLTNTPKKVFPNGVVDIAAGVSCIVCVMSDGTAFAVAARVTAIAPPKKGDGGYKACDASGVHVLLLDVQGAALHYVHASPADLSAADEALPSRVVLSAEEGDPITAFSQGTIHAGAVTAKGALYVWGDGLSGQLGLGTKLTKPLTTPTRVDFFDGASPDTTATSIGCTKGQENAKRNSTMCGQEGPRTHVTSASGALYIAGTTHKGLGADHLHKTMAPEQDHVAFYRVGGPAQDRGTKDPVPTGAAEDYKASPAKACRAMGMDSVKYGVDGCTHYLDDTHIVSSVPAHIHSAALSRDGRLFTWGCGSNGRVGLPAFMRGPGGSKRRMKCYVSTPTEVETAGKVLSFAVGKYWTLAIVESSRKASLRS